MTLNDVALVAIGRNEGERLRRCLDTVLGRVGVVVYVDSGSTDGSIDMARRKGVEVVELDMRQPFTAARARNAGFSLVLERSPHVRWVQFVDGDCEVDSVWLPRAARFLAENPEVAAVFGRRRERHPERSVYNWLCEFDWNAAPGPSRYCGGDVMMRAAALRAVGGYRDDLIAGEEPELCVRLRANAWLIHSLDAEMTLHDASMMHFHQWWVRTVRTGFAYAQGVDLHGAPPERHRLRESRSLVLWGLCLPLAAIAGTVQFGPWAAALLLVYPVQVARLALKGTGTPRERMLRASFLVIGKFPEAQGALRYLRLRLLRRPAALIEYK